MYVLRKKNPKDKKTLFLHFITTFHNFALIIKMPTIMVIIFWDFLMLEKILLSIQVKQSVIISNEHDIYKMPREFSNDLRLKILEN